MRIGKIGNTTFHFSIIGSIILSLFVWLIMSGLKGCNSNDYDTDAYIERESDNIATRIVDGLFRRSDY
jgi:hypothetical protein